MYKGQTMDVWQCFYQGKSDAIVIQYNVAYSNVAYIDKNKISQW